MEPSSEQYKQQLSAEYQEKYGPTLRKLSGFIADLEASNNLEGLIFLYESISAVIGHSMKAVARHRQGGGLN